MLRDCNVQNPWIQQRADPYVYKHKDGNYYFTASVPTYDRLVFRKSDTLDGLSKAPETVIWTKHEEGIMGAHIWAPEVKGNPLYNPNRHAMMLEVTWDGNGNPVFSFE